MWGRRLFTADPNVPEIEKFAIVDYSGLFYIDKEYKNLGVGEGWLVYNGYRRNADNEMVYLYRHTG